VQARALGVSLRRLQGWEPSSRTEYEYDDDGRLVAATTTQEPEFGPTDHDWLVALAALEAEEGPHGHLMSDALSAEADPANPDGAFEFVAGHPVQSPEGAWVRAPLIDYAEKARLDMRDRLQAADPKAHLNGVVIPVYKVPRRRRVSPLKHTTPQQQ